MIEILLATYNGEKYLEEQLASIENQTYKNWRLRVHDDQSVDATWRILKDFQKKHGEEKVILKKNIPASGGSKNNFIGLIQASDADYMMCCDQDDVWHKDKIEKTYRRMRQMEKRYGKDLPLLVYTDLKVVDSDLNEIDPSFHACMNLRTDSKLYYEMIQNQVTGCTMMLSGAFKDYMNRVKNAEYIVMHDHWLAVIALVFGKMSYLDQVTMDYRQHGDNVVGAQNARSLAYMWIRFKRGREQFVQDMKASCRQIAYFCILYKTCIESEKVIKLLDTYAQLYDVNKVERLYYFFKFRFWKKGIIRKIMQMIWG